MVETPSRDLRFRIVGNLSATVPFKRVMTASRGQLLHWLLELVEKDQVQRVAIGAAFCHSGPFARGSHP